MAGWSSMSSLSLFDYECVCELIFDHDDDDDGNSHFTFISRFVLISFFVAEKAGRQANKMQIYYGHKKREIVTKHAPLFTCRTSRQWKQVYCGGTYNHVYKYRHTFYSVHRRQRKKTGEMKRDEVRLDSTYPFPGNKREKVLRVAWKLLTHTLSFFHGHRILSGFLQHPCIMVFLSHDDCFFWKEDSRRKLAFPWFSPVKLHCCCSSLLKLQNCIDTWSS